MTESEIYCNKDKKIMPLKKRAKEIVKRLEAMYPDADCTLEYKEPFKLLISGILAAQCTDARVNIVASELFSRYNDLDSIALADENDIKKIIRSCGFYNSKARYILKSMQILQKDFGGRVPDNRDDLVSLPGVGRKIANLILGDCYGIPAVVVDTHCLRISRRLGLSKGSDPLKTEMSLMKIIPSEHWISYGHRIVAHGREICNAKKPMCCSCQLRCLCNTGRKTLD